jgi:hypothetical protein
MKKLRKFMGTQDDLAVVAAARALAVSGLLSHRGEGDPGESGLGERAGLYLVAGYIPFEHADLEPLLAGSLDESGRFSLECFSTTGFRAVNGLLTFRCLPNMPAFHISVNFGIQGPYFVTYPGPGQFYLALEEACTALAEGTIDVALVGGVAHQRNFLVQSHYQRINPPVPADQLLDAAGFLVLERRCQVLDRAAHERGRLLAWEVSYRTHEVFFEVLAPEERFTAGERPASSIPGNLGAASLPVFLSLAANSGEREVEHVLSTRDGLFGRSTWRLS